MNRENPRVTGKESEKLLKYLDIAEKHEVNSDNNLVFSRFSL